MKVMVCANLLVGDAGVLSMPPNTLRKWSQDKIEALASAIELGRAEGAESCIVAGGLFVEGFIPQSLLEETVEELGSHEIPVSWLPFDLEAVDLATRVAVPDGVSVCRNCSDSVMDGVRVIHSGTDVELALDTSDGKVVRELGLMEPMGFGNQAKAGFLLLDIKDGKVVSEREVSCAQHPFVSRAVDLSGSSTSNEMLAAVKDAVDGIGESACVRLVLRGATPLSACFNIDKLTQILNSRFFYAEVVDECTVDLDEDELANDVSLLAEFVRMVESDDSLSPSEKSRIIRCGWNALNGKELAE